MRFYTLPPVGVPYPYLLTHLRHASETRRRKFDHAIIDSGVMIFVKNECKDYPKHFLDSYGFKSRQLTQILHDKAWFVIPDYPDDYNPGQFGDNIGKTVANISRFLAQDKVQWMPVLQARFLDYLSFFESCEQTRKVVGAYPRIGIGTVCKCERTDYIEYCCKVARQFFPNAWIHAFGLTLRALPRVRNTLDSFDSMAWTKPRRGGQGQSSCRNKTERVAFFHAYITRLSQIQGEPQVCETTAQTI